MSQQITSPLAQPVVAAPSGRDHPGLVTSAADALGSFFASLARLSIGGVEAWSDRKAARRSAHIRARGASGGRPRTPGQGESAPRR